MCVQCLWSQFSCQNRNVNRKWPPWIGIECVVHTFPQHQWSYLAGLCECGQWQLSDVPASCDCSSWNSRGKDLYRYTFNGCVEPLLAQGFGEKELVHLFHQEMLLRSRFGSKLGKRRLRDRVGSRFGVLPQTYGNGTHHCALCFCCCGFAELLWWNLEKVVYFLLYFCLHFLLCSLLSLWLDLGR